MTKDPQEVVKGSKEAWGSFVDLRRPGDPLFLGRGTWCNYCLFVCLFTSLSKSG